MNENRFGTSEKDQLQVEAFKLKRYLLLNKKRPKITWDNYKNNVIFFPLPYKSYLSVL